MRASNSGGIAPGIVWGTDSACAVRCEPSCWGLARAPVEGATDLPLGPRVLDDEWEPCQVNESVCISVILFYLFLL